jgi:hypothetical protein
MKKKILIIDDYENFLSKMKEKTLDLIGDFSKTLNNDLSELFLRDLKIDLSKNQIEELISDSEIRSIISPKIKVIDGVTTIRSKDLDKCIESLRERFASNLISFLVKNNYVDQGYDAEQNNFCFF